MSFFFKKCGFEIIPGGENYVKGDFHVLACRTEFTPTIDFSQRYRRTFLAIVADIGKNRLKK